MIDISAPAHVLVFRPLIGSLLRERNDEIEVTTRDYAQTLERFERHGIAAIVIGRHGGGPHRESRLPLGGRLARSQAPCPQARLRPRARARLARADDHRAAPGHPERNDPRLRVRDASALSRRPGRDEGRRAGGDPARADGALRRPSAQAPPVPGPEGGVLPLRLRARPPCSTKLANRERTLVVVRTPPDVSLYHRRPFFSDCLLISATRGCARGRPLAVPSSASMCGDCHCRRR